jgi:hypothetical protein
MLIFAQAPQSRARKRFFPCCRWLLCCTFSSCTSNPRLSLQYCNNHHPFQLSIHDTLCMYRRSSAGLGGVLSPMKSPAKEQQRRRRSERDSTSPALPSSSSSSLSAAAAGEFVSEHAANVGLSPPQHVFDSARDHVRASAQRALPAYGAYSDARMRSCSRLRAWPHSCISRIPIKRVCMRLWRTTCGRSRWPCV